MWYAIFCEDVPKSLALRKLARQAHLERLQNLQEQGRLLTAGPFPAIDSKDAGDNGFTGSLIIAEFNCLDDAKAWASADPYQQHGIYKNVVVKPYKKVF